MYRVLFTVFYLFSLLPMRVHYLISDMLYLLLYYIIRYRVRVVRSNLGSSFPEKSHDELMAIEHRFYRWFCDNLVESIKLMTISREEMKRRMVFTNMDELDRVIEEGRSIALYLGHFCNWEWVSSVPLWITPKARCGQIYHPIENKAFDRLYLYIRQRMGALCISMQETLRRIVEFREAGQPIIIGYISDQKPLWTNIHHWVDFLHHDTPVLTGTERIAKKFGHAVYYLDVKRIRRGYYQATFKLIADNPTQMPDYQLTDVYYQHLEASIRQVPEYWLWSHKRWSRTREEFNRRFEVVDGKVIAK